MTKFWKKRIDQMSEEEWESLCDRCGKCCLIKLQDEDTNEIFYTSLVCKQFNNNLCECKNYESRKDLVPDCIKITPDNIHELSWLPESCSYILVANNKDLPEWHHLLTGSTEEMHRLKKSVKHRVRYANKNTNYQDHIIKDKGNET